MGSVRVHVLTGLELVLRPAIRALGVAVFANVEKHTRMAVPHLHARLLARAEDAALRVEFVGTQFNGFAHTATFRLCSAKPRISDCVR